MHESDFGLPLARLVLPLPIDNSRTAIVSLSGPPRTSRPHQHRPVQGRHGQSCAHAFRAFPDLDNAVSSTNVHQTRLMCPSTAELGLANISLSSGTGQNPGPNSGSCQA